MGWQGQPSAMNKDDNAEWVCLHPFDHQVGGHTGVLLVDKTTICKPLVPREYITYEAMSPSLKKFVPKLKGWTNVHICKDKDGNVSLFTLPIGTNGSAPCEDCRLGTPWHPDKNGDTNGKVVITNGNKKSPCAFHGNPHNFMQVDENYEVADNICEALNNPWSLRCWKRQLWTFQQTGVTKSCKYILLENLASKFKHPSILDLKIGTRGYGDDVTEEKRRAHVAKAKLSTAGTLGVRIGGMQVYQVDKDSYLRFTKHYGKAISDYNTLLSTIQEYFHDGVGIRRAVLSQFIKRLKSLIGVIMKEDGCRFFGCSLLVLYEGGPSSLKQDTLAGGDLPNTCQVGSEPSHTCPSTTSAKDIPENGGYLQKRPPGDTPSSCRDHSCTADCDSPSTTTSNSRDPVPTSGSNSSDLASASGGELELKVIDFPHVVYQTEVASTIYDGPDDNFLFGLNNLLEITEKIQANI